MITDDEINSLISGIDTTKAVTPHESEDMSMLTQQVQKLVEDAETPEEMQLKFGIFLLPMAEIMDESEFDPEDPEDAYILEAIRMARKHVKTQKKANKQKNNSRRKK